MGCLAVSCWSLRRNHDGWGGRQNVQQRARRYLGYETSFCELHTTSEVALFVLDALETAGSLIRLSNTYTMNWVDQYLEGFVLYHYLQ